MRVRTRFLALTAALSVLLVALLVVAAVLVKFPDEVQQRLGDAGRPAAHVVDLHDVGQLEAAFNQDAGTPRLVLLFSPT